MIFEKIRERLQEQAERYQESLEGQHCMDYRWIDEEGLQATEEAIDIINQVEAEYNNGWIPCSERLPEEDSVYIITLVDSSEGIRYTAVANLTLEHPKRKWWDVDSEYIYFDNVIAWMPLPKPYKPKGE